jgi:acetamidase/formamidase
MCGVAAMSSRLPVACAPFAELTGPAIVGFSIPFGAAMIHITPERRTLHGHFSRDLAPVAEVASGETVRFTTLDCGWGLEPRDGGGEPVRQFGPRDGTLDEGHALCGPVAIRGALPGMSLEIRIGEVRPGSWGWSEAGGWPNPVNSRLGLDTEMCRLHWHLDAERGIAISSLDRRVAMAPFMEVMGMPPAEAGVHRTSPPRRTGGNIDLKELVTGTTLWLPIDVPGGLFSTGDGHAAQGDGEVGETAIECPIEQCDLTFVLRPDLSLKTPRAETAATWITLGFDEDLHEAMIRALDAMIDLMGDHYGMTRGEALAMASVVVDLRVTQVVNSVQGVHAVLAKDAIQ